jgi:hypothetical protein
MKTITLMLFVLAGLAGCWDKKCDGTWCVRITNQRQENAQPVFVQLLQSQESFGGMDIREVTGMVLAPGADTGWFDASEGTSRWCGAEDVCYLWRLQAEDAWSENPTCLKLAGVPNCFYKDNDYDLVLR